MNAIAASPLENALAKLTIPDLAAQLFPGWRFGKSCPSPFREDRHPSFSVYDNGRRWKDHATSEGGDVVDFLAKAHGITNADACRELIAMAGTRTASSRRSTHPSPQPREAPPRPTVEAATATTALQPMPEECRAIWDEGLAHLRGNASLQDAVNEWRGWPEGTVRTLAEDGLIACPLLKGRRGVAFPVQAPFRDELGFISTCDVGFHHRRKSEKAGERIRWTYRPNEKADNVRVAALPFVLGGGFVTYAQTLVGTEGQWDAITLASASGWLAGDAAWPENVTVFATRGASGWRPLLDAWSAFLRPSARFVLFADADAAGDNWKAQGGFVDTLRKLGHPVRVLRSNRTSAKDLNDLHRICPITSAGVSEWLTPPGRKTP